jgi:hypothetical protein
VPAVRLKVPSTRHADREAALMPGEPHLAEAVGAQHQAETIAVQLTRMEGILNLVAFRMDDISATVKEHGEEISALKMFTQRLSDDAKASRETALSLAKALKEADEARRDKSEQTWTPFQRTITALSALTAVTAVVISLIT